MPILVHGSALENFPFFPLCWSRQVSEDVQDTGPSLSTAACCAHHAAGGKAFQTLDSQLKNTAQPHVKYSGHLWVAQEVPVVVSRRHSFESPCGHMAFPLCTLGDRNREKEMQIWYFPPSYKDTYPMGLGCDTWAPSYKLNYSLNPSYPNTVTIEVTASTYECWWGERVIS